MRVGTICGVCNDPSKYCTPAIPTCFIQARSLVIPSSLTFPSIQCHHTRGLAEAGGSLNLSNASLSGERAADRASAIPAGPIVTNIISAPVIARREKVRAHGCEETAVRPIGMDRRLSKVCSSSRAASLERLSDRSGAAKPMRAANGGKPRDARGSFMPVPRRCRPR